jgi:hypothetical protein
MAVWPVRDCGANQVSRYTEKDAGKTARKPTKTLIGYDRLLWAVFVDIILN